MTTIAQLQRDTLGYLPLDFHFGTKGSGRSIYVKGQGQRLHLTNHDASIVLGMIARGDRDHDIAAWFGVNQGRIAEVKGGEFGSISAATRAELPPKGPPGVKGKRARYSLGEIAKALDAGDTTKAIDLVQQAIARYDANEA
ncbi:hypothetical protein L6654_36945 [Bradyrhizobium sp. WYCCWR 13023]|uniref:Uncharacterized protein n=1 Tax=Bradyrhizobium zhengyangense TaxID=2911009 RepID=A0A9X1RGF6_9BRAD|nr:hypothetical protein [Bradyrhizobium zhengyangense]MCG2632209.1 hypothetical protein [Bradyrhizobium zhengyangense]MCG2673023.1 hypothetical protein [Bradyrhizobium zhengyangense]